MTMFQLQNVTMWFGVLLSAFITCSDAIHLSADLNMNGLKAKVLFYQTRSSQPVEIKVETNSSLTGPWAIHEHPIIYGKNVFTSCSDVGEIIDGGNLTKSVGKFGVKHNYTVNGLALSGNTTLFGRALVIYEEDTNAIKACASILSNSETLTYASVVLQGKVSGKIDFLQVTSLWPSSVLIIGELFHVDGTTAVTSGHEWFISGNSVTGNCSSVGNIFGSGNNGCSMYNHADCAQGDLTRKFGTISVGIANKISKRFRLIDLNLVLSLLVTGSGNALVLKSNGQPSACGNIHKAGPVKSTAVYPVGHQSGVKGSIEFIQASPYHPTKVIVSLQGLSKNAGGYHVHDFPIPYPTPISNVCSGSNVGAHLNPYKVNNKAQSYPAPKEGTSDKYELGDLSGKFGSLKGQDTVNSINYDPNIPVYGQHSILGRALVIHKDDMSSSRWLCANILPKDAVMLFARANFTETSDLVGYVDLEQYIQDNGVKTETGITIYLRYKNESKVTTGHNWHVHIDPVGNDSNTNNGRCQSVKGHYNPHSVNTQGNYGSECSPEFPLRCESGDTSGKQTQYSIGGGRRYFVDGDTQLFGNTTVFERSFTFHAASKGGKRIACADLVPRIGQYAEKIYYNFYQENKASFAVKTFKEEVSSALSIKPWQVGYVKRSDSSEKGCNSKVNFYLFGHRSSETGKKLKDLFSDVSLSSFKKCSTGNSITPNLSLLSLAILSFFLLFRGD